MGACDCLNSLVLSMGAGEMAGTFWCLQNRATKICLDYVSGKLPLHRREWSYLAHFVKVAGKAF